MASNTTVARTATEALQCKASSASLEVGRQASHMHRQTPLLNRFYHMRSRLMHGMVSACVGTLSPPRGCASLQLLVLGAGMDTSFETAHSSSACVVFAVDLPEIMNNRATSSAVAVAGDLRDADGVWQRLAERGFRGDVLTVVLAECVLCYLETDHVRRLLEVLAQRLARRTLMVLYDPTLPASAAEMAETAHAPEPEPDGFAATMHRQFRARGAPLRHCCTSFAAHCAFVRACGWLHVSGFTVHEAWQVRAPGCAASRTSFRHTDPLFPFHALGRRSSPPRAAPSPQMPSPSMSTPPSPASAGPTQSRSRARQRPRFRLRGRH